MGIQASHYDLEALAESFLSHLQARNKDSKPRSKSAAELGKAPLPEGLDCRAGLHHSHDNLFGHRHHPDNSKSAGLTGPKPARSALAKYLRIFKTIICRCERP